MSLPPFPENTDPFSFTGSVGRNGENDRADVIKAQMLLSSMGEYDLPAPGVPTGWAGEPLFRAIGKVQKANGLPVDGLLLPLLGGAVGENGEGETLMSLQGLLGDRLRGQTIPTPQQVDGFFETYARNPDAPLPYVTKEIRGGEPALTIQTKEVRRPTSGPHIQLLNGTMTDEAPASPPAAGEQTAALPLALMAAPYLLTGAAAIGAGQYLKQQYEKNGAPFTRSPDVPSAPPSRPINDAEAGLTKTPPLTPPKLDDPPPGRPEADRLPANYPHIPPDTKEWISGLPPAQQPVAEGLAGIIVEAHQFGPRGSPQTEQATQIVTQVCFDQLRKRPDLAGKLFHVAGSYDEEGNPLTEEWVPRPDAKNAQGGEKLKGGVHVDTSFGPPDDKEKITPYWARMQTVDFSKRADEHDPEGRYKREKEADARLLENMKTGVSEWARKMRPGETAAEYASYAKIRCDRMWDKLEAQLRRDGRLPAR